VQGDDVPAVLVVDILRVADELASDEATTFAARQVGQQGQDSAGGGDGLGRHGLRRGRRGTRGGTDDGGCDRQEWVHTDN
jgi:hypothetical protein